MNRVTVDLETLLASMGDLGAIRSQLQEIIESKRDDKARVEVMSRAMAKLEDIPGKLERMEGRIDGRMEKIEGRLTSLETDNSNRKVVNNVWLEVLKSPVVGWLVATAGALVTFIAYISKGA